MSVERDTARRESPVEGRGVKTDDSQARGNATENKTAGRDPRQGIARHFQERDSSYTTRSHKSIHRLPNDRRRTDSREQIYSTLCAWDGQTHE